MNLFDRLFLYVLFDPFGRFGRLFLYDQWVRFDHYDL